MKCPYCKTEGAYVTDQTVECPNVRCEFFVPKKERDFSFSLSIEECKEALNKTPYWGTSEGLT